MEMALLALSKMFSMEVMAAPLTKAESFRTFPIVLKL